jgi:hypothetical protein
MSAQFGGNKRAHRIPMIDAAEDDALTDWRRHLHFNPGTRSAIKRQYNKRQRRVLRRMCWIHLWN